MARTMVSIGAGKGQYPLIMAARAQGLDVVAIDRAPDAKTAALLSDWIENSTYDAEAAVEKLAAMQSKYDFIAVLARTSGPALHTAARVADALHIRGIPQTFARASVSKSELRNAAADLGIETPNGIKLAKPDAPPFDGPWVVKPDQPLTGKKNVRIAHDERDYVKAFSAAAEESFNDHVEVQAYIDGIDIGLMVLIREGEWVLDLLYDELTSFRDFRARGTGISAPSALCGTDVEVQAKDRAQRLLKAWNMRNGFAFFSFRVGPQGGLYLFEANPGLCGDDIADRLLPTVFPGFSPFDAEVQALRGAPIEAPKTPPGLCTLIGPDVTAFETEQQRMNALAKTDGLEDIVADMSALLDQFKSGGVKCLAR